MATGYKNVTATKIKDGGGHPLAAGRITFFPVSTITRGAVSAIAGGDDGGLITQTGVTFLIVNGAITTDLVGGPAKLADTLQTTPQNIAYRMEITDATGATVQGPGYDLVQTMDASLNLDTYPPRQPLQVTIQTGPAGPTGPTGATGPAGATGPQGVPGGSFTSSNLAAIIGASTSPTRCVFDLTKIIQDVAIDGSGNVEGGFAGYCVSGFCYVGDLTHIIANFPFQNNGLSGALACYDATGAFTGNIATAYPTAPNTSIALPSGTAFIRFGDHDVTNTQWLPRRVWGGTVAPAADKPFVTWEAITAADAVVAAANRPFTGQTALMVGDSITAGGQWAGTFAAYHALAAHSILGYPGHPTAECYLGYALAYFANPSGPSIAQQLATALATTDLMFIFHGTNDHDTPLGAFGDSPYVPTAYSGGQAGSTSFYGSVEYAVQTALTAISLSGRNIKLIYVTPYHTSILNESSHTKLSQVVTAIKQVCGEYGVPVIDNAATLLINSTNWATTLLLETDGNRIHPTSLGYGLLAQNIIQQAVAPSAGGVTALPTSPTFTSVQTQAFQVSDPGAGPTAVGQFLMPNLGAGNFLAVGFGKSITPGNSGFFTWNNTANPFFGVSTYANSSPAAFSGSQIWLNGGPVHVGNANATGGSTLPAAPGLFHVGSANQFYVKSDGSVVVNGKTLVFNSDGTVTWT